MIAADELICPGSSAQRGLWASFSKVRIGSRAKVPIRLTQSPPSATLKLAPLLPTRVAVVSFDTGVEAAVRAATEVTTAGLPIRTSNFA